MSKKIIEFTNKDTDFINKTGFKIFGLTNEHCIMKYEIKKYGLNPYSS